ncbi:MAG: nucleotidyltransferase domain-containing protein [Deltaproteobacteria bacterium]|nr:nucleotidyltransferase domain-containing protein [Deltaproteobacteria bacterium]
MGMSGRLDITDRQREEIMTLLSRYLPGVKIWAFGSRVKSSARPHSDLDLVAFAKPDQKTRLSELKEAFEESSLPFRVDLHVWLELPESFQKNIEAEYAVLQEAYPES